MATKVVEIKTLKQGKYLVLGGEASKITSISTSSPGKHGAAKARIEAVGIFDNQKRSLVKPVNAKVDVPIIDKRVGQVIALMGTEVQLMDLETYETIDLPIPDDIDNLKRLKDAIRTLVNKNEVILIYPEAHIWPYYTKIRNFKDVSFTYPAEFNKPVVPAVTVFTGKPNRC